MADSMSTGSATTRNMERTGADLLDAAVALTLRGQDPTMRAVAAQAGVGERTIYRYFPNRQALTEAVFLHISPRLGVPLCDTADELEGYVRRLFGLFEENRALTVAVVASPTAQAVLAGSRTRNLRDLTELLQRAHPDAPARELEAAAASLRTVISGAGWTFQRDSCGISAEAVVDHAIWLVQVVRARLASMSS